MLRSRAMLETSTHTKYRQTDDLQKGTRCIAKMTRLSLYADMKLVAVYRDPR
jgi:hypothetical protein